MNRYAKLLSFVFIALVSLAGWAFRQPANDLIQGIIDRLVAYTSAYPQETVWLHTDKPYYAQGDDLWFRAYVSEANSGQPSPLSNILYIDLLNAEGKIIEHIILPVDMGVAFGDFQLKGNLPEGTYHLRAYTNWMRNFDEALFFSQPFSLYNPTARDEQVEDKIPQLEDIRLQFFPEGGDLVAGFPNRIAFKAEAPGAIPFPVDGFVISSQGMKVARIETFHEGMGSFRMVPLTGEKYMARVFNPDSSYRDYPLPEVKAEGLAVNVTHTEADSIIKVQLYPSVAIREQKSTLALICQAKGKVYYAAEAPASSAIVTLLVPKSSLPGGIVQLTVFNQKQEPLAERLVFVNNLPELQVKISSDKNQLNSRDKWTLNVEVSDTKGQPLAADLSMAVLDETKVPVTDAFAATLHSHLHLLSDLPGYIASPGFYLQKNNAKAHQALDLLLMTHGWRRFVWKKVLSDDKPQFQYPIEQTLALSGRAMLTSGKPLVNGSMTLMGINKSLMLMTDTDANGYFTFNGVEQTDSIEMVIQARTEKDRKNVNIELNPPRALPESRKDRLPILGDAYDMLSEYLSYRRRQTQADISFDGLADMELKAVEIRDTKIKPEESFSARNIYGSPDYSITSKDVNFSVVATTGNVLQALQGRVPGIQVRTDQFGNTTVQIRGASSIGAGTEPLLLIDGVPQPDLASARLISPNDVEAIDILRDASAAIFGASANTGVISIITKRGQGGNVAPREGVVNHKIQGYYKSREFFIPPYESTGINQPKPDLRTTVYWNPLVQVDSTGKASVSFFVADNPEKYRVVLEGLAPNGLATHQEMVFNVKQ